MSELEKLKKYSTIFSEEIKESCGDNNFVIDGVINPQKYLNAKYRILWILKEANSEMDSWSYLDKFVDEQWLYRCGKSVPTLRRIIYTTYGILRESNWSDIPDAGNKLSFEPLEEIALINIKKIPGHSSADNAQIQEAYFRNHELLAKQIEVYNADIVIFGNTLQFFYKSDFQGLEEAEKQTTDYGNVFYDTGKKLYIHTWHPSARGAGFTDESYVMDLVNIVKKWNRNN